MRKTLEVNDSYIPFLNASQRTQIFFGGSSSGKSFFLSQRVVMDVVKGRNYLIVRNVGSTIRHSVFNQIVKTIRAFGLESFFHISGNLVITYKPNGRQILFSGLDDVEKLKSITPQVGVLTDVWIEEATEVPYEAYKQLTKRLRGVTGDEDMDSMTKRVTFSFNPVLRTHWIYREFFGNWDDSKRKYETNKLLILKTTYKDNHYLTEDDISSLEDETDPYFYNVYTLGNWGVLGKVIFKNWRTEDLSELVPKFDRIYNGIDFGFSSDPNAFVRVHVDETRRKIYVFDELYKAGMTNDELIAEVKPRIGMQYITCDSAEPKTIDEFCRAGIRALPAVKGKDSVTYGIDWLLRFEIIIDIRCQHFKNEIQAYHWAEDKYGNALRKPVDKENHCMDALRYACEPLMLQGRAQATRRI